MTQSIQAYPLLNSSPLSPEVGNEKLTEWLTTDSIALLAQADLLLLLAQLFAPPSAVKPVILDIEAVDIHDLLEKTGFSDPNPLQERFQQIRRQAEMTDLDSWMGEYNRLFETNVACPINETGIIRRDKGVILADISGFYNAFGFELSEDASEKADHLTGELEYIAMLLVMLTQTQDEEELRTTYNALSAFCADHIGDWLPTFCERLMETTDLLFYRQLAELLRDAWSEVTAINRLPIPDGEMMQLPEDDGTPYECGMAGDCLAGDCKGAPQ